MRLIFYFILFILINRTAFGQDYAVNRIPDELKARASAVVQLSETTIEVKSLDMTVYKVKRAVTVLNKNGDADAGLQLFYDKSQQIRSAGGVIYNEIGIPSAKFSEKNFKDESAGDGSSLFTDGRIKRFSPAQTIYPYTIEYEYEIRRKQTLIFPDWMPVYSSGVSLQNASLTFICKPDFEIRYKEQNYPGTAETGSGKDGNKTYTWKLSGIKPSGMNPTALIPKLIFHL